MHTVCTLYIVESLLKESNSHCMGPGASQSQPMLKSIKSFWTSLAIVCGDPIPSIHNAVLYFCVFKTMFLCIQVEEYERVHAQCLGVSLAAPAPASHYMSWHMMRYQGTPCSWTYWVNHLTNGHTVLKRKKLTKSETSVISSFNDIGSNVSRNTARNK